MIAKATEDSKLYEPRDVVKSNAELRKLLGEVPPTQATKAIDFIDHHCEAWIKRAPFVVISSIKADGTIDVSPKGDPSGFVKVIDKYTLAIPDRPGNRRVDTMHNLLDNPQLGLMFIIPRRGEVLRIAGSGCISRDPLLLADMSANGRIPKLAVVVRVTNAMFHCGKAMIRSNMWNLDNWPDLDGLPTYAEALTDHADPIYSLDEMEARVAYNETKRLYDDEPQ